MKPPVTLAVTRLMLAAVVLAGVAVLAGQMVPRGTRIWVTIALAGLFGNALPFTLINWGQQVIDLFQPNFRAKAMVIPRAACKALDLVQRHGNFVI